MTRIILTGCCGKMGHVIQSIVANREDCKIVAGVDIYDSKDCDFPVYSSIKDITEQADAVIDFSNPSLLDGILDFGKTTKTPLVIATTGYDECQKKQIEEASKECAVFFTYNYSMGVNLLASLALIVLDFLDLLERAGEVYI